MKVGDTIPKVTVFTVENGKPTTKDLHTLFAGKKARNSCILAAVRARAHILRRRFYSVFRAPTLPRALRSTALALC